LAADASIDVVLASPSGVYPHVTIDGMCLGDAELYIYEGATTTGGSGIIILRCPSARVFTVSPGTNTITTEPASGDQIATFTVTGKLKAIK
jgi:hypothetical protein